MFTRILEMELETFIWTVMFSFFPSHSFLIVCFMFFNLGINLIMTLLPYGVMLIFYTTLTAEVFVDTNVSI